MFTNSYVLYVHNFLTYIHTLSLKFQTCNYAMLLLYGSIIASALEAEVEITHTSDSGVFMMAENLKHLEYLKCHNPTHFQPSTELQKPVKMVHLIRTNINQFLIHLLTKNAMKQSNTSIKLFQYYEQGVKCDFHMVQLSLRKKNLVLLVGR